MKNCPAWPFPDPFVEQTLRCSNNTIISIPTRLEADGRTAREAHMSASNVSVPLILLVSLQPVHSLPNIVPALAAFSFSFSLQVQDDRLHHICYFGIG